MASAELSRRVEKVVGYPPLSEIPLLLIGEGTSKIQRMGIGKKLLERTRI